MSVDAVRDILLDSWWLWGIVLVPMVVYWLLMLFSPVLIPLVEATWKRKFLRDVRIIKRPASWWSPKALEMDTGRWEDDGGR
jgi:hypothetical protein